MALIEEFFTDTLENPFDSVEWEHRDAVIKGADGKEVFRQNNVEVPKNWSQLALNIVASKYFAGKQGSPERETSVRQLIDRVAATIAAKGIKYGYFDVNGSIPNPNISGKDEASLFYRELCYILVNQMASFNSPVWFNIGVPGRRQQASACFILDVEDDIESILNWIYEEGMIFKGGSGSGVNLSKLRGSHEALSTGGVASGPVSFMRGADASAGAIKSGGTTRRAAKMCILDFDHPDILEFVRAKAHEEKKAWALGEAGYDMGLNGEAWQSIQFQNANNSVRVSNAFMEKATYKNKALTVSPETLPLGKEFALVNRTDGQVAETMNARDLLMEIAEATHICGDPGIQYDDTCNLWHTLPNIGKQRGSNPCSEYMSVDNSACNLASINLLKFTTNGYAFDFDEFEHVVRLLITAQDILVELSEYPTEKITYNAKRQRQLGLGYANLGAMLMSMGVAYDSPEGRELAAAVTSLMTATAYHQGAKIAMDMGSFTDFDANQDAFVKVMDMHLNHNKLLAPSLLEDNTEVVVRAGKLWNSVVQSAKDGWARNAQATVLAPTGTIGFMMDCATTGIEPPIALVSYKTMVGGGYEKLVMPTVELALEYLEYEEEEIASILKYIEKNDTIEGAPELNGAHLRIFDCAFKAQNGTRSIGYLGHIKMMGVVQPFLSGAISKTVNLPEEATVEDIFEAYVAAWKLGVKAIAIYRDGSKRTQPLTTKKEVAPETILIQPELEEVAKKILDTSENESYTPEYEPVRRRLPKTRTSITHHFDIAGHDGYITVGLYEDGSPGEVFVTMAKQGSTLQGLMDSFAIAVSIGLQHGVPVETFITKFAHTRFEPSGFTGFKEIPMAKSLIDYLARWLAVNFMSHEDAHNVGVHIEAPHYDEEPGPTAGEIADILDKYIPSDEEKDEEETSTVVNAPQKKEYKVDISDAPMCHNCGGTTARTGTCYTCLECGSSSGCS